MVHAAKGYAMMNASGCFLVLLQVLAAGHLSVWAESLPEPAPVHDRIIHPLDYRSMDEARASWKPVYGCAPVAVAPAGGRQVLKLPCIFKGNALERGNWEWAVDLDLAACRGVELQLYCDDLSPISSFTLYFQTGQGWYGLNFNPEYTGRWCRVVLDKSRAIPEGAPAGWSKIRTIRFSAWRGYDADTTVYLANLAMLGADAPIVLARPASLSRPAKRVVDVLGRYDLPYFAVNESELTPELLAGRSVLWMLGPGDASRARIGGFQGKVLTLDDLGEQAGTPEGEAAEAVMRCLAGAYPQAWDLAVTRALARAGEIAGYASPDAVVQSIRDTAGGNRSRPAVERQLELAAQLREEVGEQQAAGRPAQALARAEQARVALIEAYCLAQSPKPGEFRAFWCHEAYGVKGMSWDASIRILAENGFTAIVPNMLWAGVAYYDSDVLPVSPMVAERGNLLTECLEACRKYGVECHVWKVNFYMSGRSPADFRERMKREGRTLVEFNGRAKDDWLCPSHPENRKLEIDSMVEVARRYDVNGIHFDYIRYPGPEGCFCDGCRERFERVVGRKIANWPADTRQDPALSQRWLDWRRENITAVVAGVAEQARKLEPEVKLSAAVFRIWPVDRDGVGQDWKDWCDKGYLDFICPMDYTPNIPQFREMIRHQLEWAGSVPCYPGVGLSVWPERNDVCRLVEQINVTRELNTGGFTVFNYAESEARNVLPMLGKGITRPE